MTQKINQNQLLQLACNASQNAYAPYSKFRVGASVLYANGKVYTGCNVENASYGLSLCAERNAISSAIADGADYKKIKAIAVYSPDSNLCYPCGACRQWIAEFSKDAVIILEGADKESVSYFISELLPNSFNF